MRADQLFPAHAPMNPGKELPAGDSRPAPSWRSHVLMCLQVEISKTYGLQEWRDDLRKVLKLAGEANKKVNTAAQQAGCHGTALACFFPQSDSLSDLFKLHPDLSSGLTQPSCAWSLAV